MLTEKVLECLCGLGIYADKDDLLVPLESLIQESLTYVSFIVELENVLGIQIPDSFLQVSTFESLNDMIEALKLLV